MQQTTHIGYNTAKNELNPFFDFNDPYVWITDYGEGTAEHNAAKSYYGSRCLKIVHSDVATELSVSVNIDTQIEHTDNYGFAFFLFNPFLFENIKGNVLIKKETPDGYLTLANEPFSIGSQTDENSPQAQKWLRHTIDSDLDLNVNDKLRLIIRLSPNNNVSLPSAVLYADGFFLYKKNRQQTAPPQYQPVVFLGEDKSAEVRQFHWIEGNRFEYIRNKTNNSNLLRKGDKAVNGNISDTEFGVLLEYKGTGFDGSLFSGWEILISQ